MPGYQNLAWSIGWFRPNGNAGSVVSVPVTQFSYNWKVELPSWITLPVSDVKIRVSLVKNCLNSNLPCPEPASLISVPFDESDNYFTITGPSVTGQIQVLSPNGGEEWQRGTTQLIKWKDNRQFIQPTTTTPTIYYNIRLVPRGPKCRVSPEGRVDCPLVHLFTYVIDEKVPRQPGQEIVYKWEVGKVKYNIEVAYGEYRVEVCESGTNNCDISDDYFKIVSGSVPGVIQVISPNG